MAATYAEPMSVPLRNRTERDAIMRADRDQPACGPLMVPMAAWFAERFKPQWTETKFGRDVVREAARVVH